MSYYENMSAEDLAEILIYAAREACLRLTEEWQCNTFGDEKISDVNAEFLYWQYQNSEGKHLLCERQRNNKINKHGHTNDYRLTPLGLKVKEALLLLEEK